MSKTAPLIEPLDEHNRTLVENVHPPGWVNPRPAARYHLVAVGGGTAGLVSAAGAAGLGARAALVERHLMGGDCLNVGCVPSKAVIRAARAWKEAREAAREFGGPAAAGARELRRGDGAHAPAARRHQRPRRRPPLPGPGSGRLPGRRALRLARGGRGGRRPPPLPPRRHRDRRAGGGAAGAGPQGGRLPHQRDRLLADRAARPLRGHRRRADRLRAGAGLRALRQPGDGHRHRPQAPAARGRRRRGAGAGGDGRRRHRLRAGGQDRGGAARRGRQGAGPRAPRRRAGGGRGRRDPGLRRPGAERRRAGARGGGRALRQEGRGGGRSPPHQQPAHLRRRRRGLEVPVHPRRRRHRPHRAAERPLLRPVQGERAGRALGAPTPAPRSRTSGSTSRRRRRPGTRSRP